MAVKELTDGWADGTRTGQSAAEKHAFWGAAPVAQPAATAQSAVATTAITTAATTTITSVGSTSLTAADVTRLNALIARVEEIRVVSDAAVTRIEALRALLAQIRSDLVSIGILKGSA